MKSGLANELNRSGLVPDPILFFLHSRKNLLNYNVDSTIEGIIAHSAVLLTGISGPGR